MEDILGILSIWQGDERYDRPFGSQTPLFEAISHAGNRYGFRTFVYLPQDIKQMDKLNAYSYVDGKWASVPAQAPSVVYDRIPSRKYESDSQVVTFRQFLLKKTKGRLFNFTGFFSKSKIYNSIGTILPKKLYFPETELDINPQKIISLVNLWGEAWLKPDNGSLGHGIYRIIKDPIGFTIDSSDHGSSEHLEPEEALAFLNKLLSRQNYLLQRGIQRSETNFRPFDIRVYLQKNETGKFLITKQFARVVSFGQIVSNLSSGADTYPLQQLFAPLERSNIRKLCLACSNRLHEIIPEPLGEIGLDLIADPQKRIWLIEINSKPFLKMNPNDPLTLKTANRIVGYASYLLKNPIKKVPKTPTKQLIPQPKPTLSPHVSRGR